MAILFAGRGGAGISEDGNEYWDAFRRDVFRLLAVGYGRMSSAQYSTWDEPEITGELVKAIRQVTEDSASPKWAMHFAIHDDPPLNDTERLGKRRKRSDIQFELTDIRPHPRYCFEAKKLSEKRHTGAYCGPKGVGEYVVGNYARDSHEAAMLAYVQTKDESIWADRISRAMGKRAAAVMLAPNGQWRKVYIVAELQHVYRTRHNRPALGQPITLFHILLSFC